MQFEKLVFLCSRLDMTQELLDWLDAALKMSDTGESVQSLGVYVHK